jgi:hypothetical protein
VIQIRNVADIAWWRGDEMRGEERRGELDICKQTLTRSRAEVSGWNVEWKRREGNGAKPQYDVMLG